MNDYEPMNGTDANQDGRNRQDTYTAPVDDHTHEQERSSDGQSYVNPDLDFS